MSADTSGFLSPEIADYTRRSTTPADPLEQRLIEETATRPDARMQVGVAQARVLGMLVRSVSPRCVIEIGTFTGYSTLAMAKELAENALLITCDVDPETSAIARRYWKEAEVDDRIDLRIAPAIETLATLPRDLAVDLAFIDADKVNYRNYLEALFPFLTGKSVVVVDNVLWGGQVLDLADQSESTVALRDFNDWVANDPRFDVVMLPIGDGLSLITLSK